MDSNETNNATTQNTNDAGATDQNASGASGAAADSQPQARMFTQEEVSKMMAREKHQGKNSVYNELGIDPDDTSAIQMFKAFVESQKSKEEKQLEKAAKQDEALAEANQKLKIAETKAALMQAGVLGDFVDDAVTIALSRIAADDSLEIDTVAKDLKSKYSVWFGESGESTDTGKTVETKEKSTGQKGTGTTVGTNAGSAGSGSKVAGIGARLAASKKASMGAGKSFWD